jgi:murein DD-endopeptidase MepM/ murein hydrolase activator NlpD
MAWEFLPGMRFGERTAWWRGGAARETPHEGLDLSRFRTREGGTVILGPGARVPVLWPGAVAAVVTDFLGASVFVAHDRRDGQGRLLHTVYGHLSPPTWLAPGGALRDGDEVGTVADPAGRRTVAPPHLHLTVALIADSAAGTLDWRVLRDPVRAVLLDPLPFVCGTMRLLEEGSGDNVERG